MDKEKLRKADLVSSILFFIFGFWIILQATEMPMTDSWGGVQNVWYVSPALFPLFVGGALMLLSLILFRTAVGALGMHKAQKAVGDLFAAARGGNIASTGNIRFLAILVLFFSYVYLNIPRMDFFIASILFLLAFILMFYSEDTAILSRLLVWYSVGSLGILAHHLFGFHRALQESLPHSTDMLGIALTAAMAMCGFDLMRGDPQQKKRYRTAVLVAVLTPFIIGPIFKYFLLVPLPCEGLIVEFMDMLWYGEF